MADVLTPEQRKKNMSSIKSKNTKPEIIVRKMAHSLGFRFRLHKAELPGKPDLVFTRLKKIIFVHGCFWHMHECKYGSVRPKTNATFWEEKRLKNVKHDRWAEDALSKDGWSILTIWECETRKTNMLKNRIELFLSESKTKETN